MSANLVVLAHREPYQEQAGENSPGLTLKTNGVFRTFLVSIRVNAA